MIERIAIMGTGSLGTILGAYIAKGGMDVTLVDAWKEHVDALNENGATVVGEVNMNVPVNACTPEEMDGTFDLFIYLAKQTFNETAIPQMISHCHENTIICTGQNGIPELAVAEYWPKDKICGATVGWDAGIVSPGISRLTASPKGPNFNMHLGTLEGPVTPWLEEVKDIIELMCPVFLTEELINDRWSKILINATLSGMSTVVNGTFGDACSTDHGRECLVRIGREVVQVCHAQGIRLPEIFGVDFDSVLSYKTALEEGYVKSMFAQLGAQKGKASMLQDLEKGRKCEIKYINGVVADAGRKAGIDTPYTDAVIQIVEEIQEGKRPLSADNLNSMPHLPL